MSSIKYTLKQKEGKKDIMAVWSAGHAGYTFSLKKYIYQNGETLSASILLKQGHCAAC